MNLCYHATSGQLAAGLLYAAQTIPHPTQKADDRPFTFSTFRGVAEIPVQDWLAVNPALPKPLSPDCLTLLESEAQKSLSSHCYVLVYQDNRPVGAFSFHAIPLGAQWLSSPQLRQLPFAGLMARALSCNCLLLCGNPFLTGPLGFATAPDLLPDTVARMAHEVTQVVRKTIPRAQGVLFKDVPEDIAEAMQSRGLLSAPAEPNMVLALAPEWATFQDYTAAMSTKYRQRVTSTYKKSAALTTERLTLEQVDAMQDELYALFLQVFRDGRFSLAEPGRSYLSVLRERMREACSIVVYRLEGRAVAFRTVLVGNQGLDCHFVGYEQSLNHDYKLYQRMLYDFIADGLALGLTEIRFGRTATEIKSTVGAMPQPLENVVEWFCPGVSHVARRMMRKVQMPEYTLRHPFKE